jgi:hypothetical protein
MPPPAHALPKRRVLARAASALLFVALTLAIPARAQLAVSLSSPNANATFPAGGSITLSATATPSAGASITCSRPS